MKTEKILRNHNGFTLIELMVSLAVASILFYGIFSVMRVGSDQVNVVSTKVTLNDTARNGMTRLLEEIRETAPSEIQLTPTTLSFKLVSNVDDQGNVTWGDTVTYALGGANNSQLIRTVQETGATSVAATNLQSVSFQGNSPTNPTLVHVQLNLQRQSLRGNMYSDIITGEGRVRNE